MYDFDEIIPRQGSNCIKYDHLGKHFPREDLLPMWVADMDFPAPSFITDALKKRLEHPFFGYTGIPEGYFEQISSWVEQLHGWKTDPQWIRYIPGIVKGIGMVLGAFLERGDKVIIQTPVYHPFRLVPQNNGYEVVFNPLIPVYETGPGKPDEVLGEDWNKTLQGYEMDFDHLESIIDDKTKVLILSNPHNPCGICWSRETLERLAEITCRREVLVISDEIHSEMALYGNKHIPYASVNEMAASNSITFMAPSKTFNIAGIVSSYAIVPDPEVREQFFNYLSANELDCPDIFAPIATAAVYTPQGKIWRDSMLEYVRVNIEYLDYYLRSYIPEIKVVKPQASFLVWLDCRGLDLSQEKLVDLFVNKAHLALNDGIMFGAEGEGFMRMNVGCPKKILFKALSQLRKAVEEA